MEFSSLTFSTLVVLQVMTVIQDSAVFNTSVNINIIGSKADQNESYLVHITNEVVVCCIT